MSYEPWLAFLAGACSVFAGFPDSRRDPVPGVRLAPLPGWPAPGECSERAFAVARIAVLADPRRETMERHEAILEHARAEDWRRISRAGFACGAGQAVSVLVAVALMGAAVAVAAKSQGDLRAFAGHDRLAMLPAVAFFGQAAGAHAWVLLRRPR